MLLQVGLPVQPDRPRDVALVIRARVDVDLEYANIRVLCVVREPIGLDQYVFGISGHGESPKEKSSLTLGGGDSEAAQTRCYGPPMDRRRSGGKPGTVSAEN